MFKLIKLWAIAAFLFVVAPANGADGSYGGYGTSAPMGPGYAGTAQPRKPESYGQTMSRKLGSGFSNLLLGWLEIPKNMINTNNEVNFALGAIGGPVKGVLHSMGRVMTGVFDVLTFPVPTQSLTTPTYVWENFSVETRYNPIKMQQ